MVHASWFAPHGRESAPALGTPRPPRQGRISRGAPQPTTPRPNLQCLKAAGKRVSNIFNPVGFQSNFRRIRIWGLRGSRDSYLATSHYTISSRRFVGAWGEESQAGNRFVSFVRARGVHCLVRTSLKRDACGFSLFPLSWGGFPLSLETPPKKLLSNFSWLYRYMCIDLLYRVSITGWSIPFSNPIVVFCGISICRNWS